MAFTNIAIVRQHLREKVLAGDTFSDAAVRLKGVQPTSLVHSNISDGSVVVKGKNFGTPRLVRIVAAEPTMSLGVTQLIPDSVVAASDTSLGTIYREDADYIVDYRSGLFTTIASGSIAEGQLLAVWYYSYTIFTEGVDYHVDYIQGTLRRTASSAIIDGQTIFVDYRIEQGRFADSQIATAISEADDRLLRLIAPDHRQSINQTLVTAETYLAVSILCRMRATELLQPGAAAAAATTANQWQKLAREYEEAALNLAAPFTPALPRLQSPRVARGRGHRR